MKLEEFINKYTNTQIDFDKKYGAQCVDLFRQYCKDVLNIPHTGSVDGAKDLYLKYDEFPLEMKYFNLIPNIDDFNLSYGDVIIWNSTSTNKYGHVAILISKISNEQILVFEQQGYSTTGKDKALFKIRNLDYCLGTLRPINRSDI